MPSTSMEEPERSEEQSPRAQAIKEASVNILDSLHEVAQSAVDQFESDVRGLAVPVEQQPELLRQALRTALEELEDRTVQIVVDSTPAKRPQRRHADDTLAEMEARAIEAILNGATWYTEEELRSAARRSSRDAADVDPRQWEEEGRVFSIVRAGRRLYPSYVFEDLARPRPAVEEVLKVFAGYSSLRIAGWFESVNSYLGGERPSDVIAYSPTEVIEAAKDHEVGPVHG